MENQFRELSIDELGTVCGCGKIDAVETKTKAPTPFADLIRDRKAASDSSNGSTSSTSTPAPIPAVTVTFGIP